MINQEEYISNICECQNHALNATVTVQKNCSMPHNSSSYIEVRYKHKSFALLPHFLDDCLDDNLTVAESAYKGVDTLRDLVIKEFGLDELLIKKAV